MILTCPACTTRFLVPDAAFGAAGRRRVRCGRCRHEWLAVSDLPVVEMDLPTLAPAMADFPEVAPRPVPAGSALPARTSRLARTLHRARAQPRAALALTIFLLALAGVTAAALTPAGSALLHRWLAPATPLTIEEVTTRYVPQVLDSAAPAPIVAPDGVTADPQTPPAAPSAPTAWSLVVEGTVRNASDGEAAVPPLILMTKDAHGALLGTYRPVPQLQQLPAHGTTGFTITLGAADPRLSEVTVQFAAE